MPSSLIWIALGVFAVFGISATYMGAKGKTKLHRLATVSGIVTILGLLAFVPVAVTVSLYAIASVSNDPVIEFLLFTYLVLLVACGLLSVITTVKIGRRSAV